MKLLVGLGNPGPSHARNRHNVGFLAIDAIADAQGGAPFRSKFDGALSEATIGGSKTLLLKPLTYMNDSGRSVGAAMRFYKLQPADVVVFHDELDLAPGKIKVKTGGGVAGHNGLRSIASHIGPEFRRVRIGIGHPGHKSAVSSYVLGDFSKADDDWLAPLMPALAVEACRLADGDAAYAAAVGQRLAPPQRKGPSRNDLDGGPGGQLSGEGKVMNEAAPDREDDPGTAIGDALKGLVKR